MIIVATCTIVWIYRTRTVGSVPASRAKTYETKGVPTRGVSQSAAKRLSVKPTQPRSDNLTTRPPRPGARLHCPDPLYKWPTRNCCYRHIHTPLVRQVLMYVVILVLLSISMATHSLVQVLRYDVIPQYYLSKLGRTTYTLIMGYMVLMYKSIGSYVQVRYG